jgi:hypothetical protein
VKVIRAIWNYFRDSWEGEDHKFSYRRFSQYLFMSLMAILALEDKTQTRWGFYTFLTAGILFALTATVITVQQLILMIKYYSQTKRFDYWNGSTTEQQSTELTQDEDTSSNNTESES